jgi:hypothetical protein
MVVMIVVAMVMMVVICKVTVAVIATLPARQFHTRP